jgi:ribosomal protein L30E
MAARKKQKGIVLSAEQRRRRRARSIVLALVLAGFAILFYAVTIVKLGPQVLHRPI